MISRIKLEVLIQSSALLAYVAHLSNCLTTTDTHIHITTETNHTY